MGEVTERGHRSEVGGEIGFREAGHGRANIACQEAGRCGIVSVAMPRATGEEGHEGDAQIAAGLEAFPTSGTRVQTEYSLCTAATG